MEPQTQLKQAAEALRNGNRSEALRMLGVLVGQEPDNAEAWLMLFSAEENPIEKCDCLKQVVRIHPNDESARQKLHKYQAGSEYREAKSRIQAEGRLVEKEKTKKHKQKEGMQKLLSSLQDLIFPRR